MTNELERDYYRRRALQEREAATKAGGAIAKLHAELADRYARLAQDDAVSRSDALPEQPVEAMG